MKRRYNNGEKAFVPAHRGRKGAQKTFGTSMSRTSMKVEKRRHERKFRMTKKADILEEQS
tara:strand:- start:540 stop:719 length:180 start_codon:yes stop_codon:yes gene_type:complete